MSQVNPIKQTTNREEIEAKLDHLYDREGVINRKFPDEPTIHDLIYDELRNLNGAMASLSAGNDIYLKALVDNTGTTAVNLRDVKQRLKEIIHLSGNVRDNTAVMSEHLESANQQLDEITTNVLDTVKGVDSIDERLVETNNLLTDTKDNETVITQDDYDKYNEEYDMSRKAKKVKLRSDERHIIYQALGSRASTLRNQIGYNRVDEDVSLRDQITKHETLIRKLKNS